MNSYEIIRTEHEWPAVPESVGPLRRTAVAFAAEHGADETTQQSVALAASEAATNAVMHAYRDRDEPGPLLLTLVAEHGEVEVQVADHGVGMTPRPDSPGMGLGLPLIAQMADSLEVASHDGTAIAMRFRLAGRG